MNIKQIKRQTKHQTNNNINFLLDELHVFENFN